MLTLYLIGCFIALISITIAVIEDIREHKDSNTDYEVSAFDLSIWIYGILASWLSVVIAILGFCANKGWINEDAIVFQIKIKK
jgi:hypothetical protein